MIAFLTSPLGRILALSAGAFLAGIGSGLKWQQGRVVAIQSKFDTFVATAKNIGVAAQERAIAQAKQDLIRKEHSDAENLSTLASLRADNKRLLDARASRGYLPTAASSSRSPETACFDRADLELAIRRLDAGVSGLVSEGDEARVGLDTARRWADH